MALNYIKTKTGVTGLNELATHRINSITVLFISILFAIASIHLHQGGIIHPEIKTYLPYYLSDKPLINKLYDSKVLDQDMYQARELSYCFDYLDSKFIEWSVLLGYPHFLSVVNYAFLIIIGLLIWHFSTKILTLSSLLGIALVMLFWTSPSIFLAGIFFRSAKVGVALFAVLLFIVIHNYLNDTSQSMRCNHPGLQWLVFFSLSWIATLFDRQGVYFVVVALIFILIWSFFFPGKYLFVAVTALGGALILGYLYNHAIGPLLTQVLNGYSPNFSYQKLPWQRVMQLPIGYALAGTTLYLDTLRFLFGNIPFPLALIGFIFLIFTTMLGIYKEYRIHGRLGKPSVIGIAIFVCNGLLFIGLDALMVLRHTPIFDPDIRRVYYWIPQVSILVCTTAFVLSYLIENKIVHTNILLILVLLAIAGNVFALPGHNEIVLQGYIQPASEYTPKLIDALQNARNPGYLPPPEVQHDPVYQYFEQTLAPEGTCK